MTIKALAQEIHENAVKHGWWDEERDGYEIVALIHSEWSEALEEARAGRGLYYRDNEVTVHVLGEDEDRIIRTNSQTQAKPEGIAVELIDGCIRILDAFAQWNVEPKDREAGLDARFDSLYSVIDIADETPEDIAITVALLHATTSRIINEGEFHGDPTCLLVAMSLALTWVKKQGLDPYKLLMEKHAYNKTRPYKHGKKF